MMIRGNSSNYNCLLNNSFFVWLLSPVSNAVGINKVFGRDISMCHYRACLYAGVRICGTNGEELASQVRSGLTGFRQRVCLYLYLHNCNTNFCYLTRHDNYYNSSVIV